MIELDVIESDLIDFKFDDDCSEGWVIEGDIPAGVCLENKALKGEFKNFFEQPACQDNYPIKPIKGDCSNWYEIGRYKHDYKDFYFTVSNKLNIYEFKVRMRKNKLIDNQLIMYGYLKERYTYLNYNGASYRVLRCLNRNGKTYTIDNFDEYVREVLCQESVETM